MGRATQHRRQRQGLHCAASRHSSGMCRVSVAALAALYDSLLCLAVLRGVVEARVVSQAARAAHEGAAHDTWRNSPVAIPPAAAPLALDEGFPRAFVDKAVAAHGLVCRAEPTIWRKVCRT